LNGVRLPASSDDDQRAAEIEITPMALNFQEEGEDEVDMSSSNDRDTVQHTPFTPSTDKEEEVLDVTPVGDLPGATILEADLKLMKVYGDYIHQNDGTHLDGGLQDDSVWQERWRRLIILPSQHYDAPSGSVGCHFVHILTEELEGICCQKWNLERFLVFQMVVLQHSKEVKTSYAIRRQLTMQMDAWEADKFTMLVQDTECTALAQLSKIQGVETQEQRAKKFTRLVLATGKAPADRSPLGLNTKSGEYYSRMIWILRQGNEPLMFSSLNIQMPEFQKPPKWRNTILCLTLRTLISPKKLSRK
jgi:hypothetical protein